jgi:hypothetical protein
MAVEHSEINPPVPLHEAQHWEAFRRERLLFLSPIAINFKMG